MTNGQFLNLRIWRSLWHESNFLDLYLGKFQRNGVQSYLKVFPLARYQSAKSSASRMLKKPRVVEAMEKKSFEQ
jgi:hypothetical protein